jgi:hypothetical protein
MVEHSLQQVAAVAVVVVVLQAATPLDQSLALAVMAFRHRSLGLLSYMAVAAVVVLEQAVQADLVAQAAAELARVVRAEAEQRTQAAAAAA